MTSYQFDGEHFLGNGRNPFAASLAKRGDSPTYPGVNGKVIIEKVKKKRVIHEVPISVG